MITKTLQITPHITIFTKQQHNVPQTRLPFNIAKVYNSKYHNKTAKRSMRFTDMDDIINKDLIKSCSGGDTYTVKDLRNIIMNK